MRPLSSASATNRRHAHAVGKVPADQRLHAEGLRAVHADLRLEDHAEIRLFHCLSHGAGQFKIAQEARAEFVAPCVRRRQALMARLACGGLGTAEGGGRVERACVLALDVAGVHAQAQFAAVRTERLTRLAK
jgi:hypothetical protein